MGDPRLGVFRFIGEEEEEPEEHEVDVRSRETVGRGAMRASASCARGYSRRLNLILSFIFSKVSSFPYKLFSIFFFLLLQRRAQCFQLYSSL